MPKEWRAAKPVKQAARTLRHDLTPAEHRLWAVLRRKRIEDARFRRQHPIHPFIVDFCCVERRLIIEVDGAVHDYTGERDVARQAWLEACGYRVIRFSNDDVMKNLEGVVEMIRREVASSESSP